MRIGLLLAGTVAALAIASPAAAKDHQVKMLNNGARAGDGAGLVGRRFRRLNRFAQPFFGQNFGSQQNALIANKDIAWPFDQAVNFRAVFAAK